MRSNCIKYLGIQVDDKLSWNYQIDNVRSRTRKLIYIFRQLRSVANKKTLIKTYKMLCESIISYCVTSWGNAPKTKMLELERAQRIVLKVLMYLPFKHPTTAVYSETEVLTVRKLYIL